MKAKFTTYMELDLQGMSAAELNDLVNKATEVLYEKRKANDPLVKDVIKGIFALSKIAEIFNSTCHVGEVTVSMLAKRNDISGYDFSPTTRARINNMLVECGYDKLK